MPGTAVALWLATCGSIAVPPTLNWLSELFIFIGAASISIIIVILCSTTVILSTLYSIWIYTQVTGSASTSLRPTPDLTRRESVMIYTLLIPVLILGIVPSCIDCLLPLNVMASVAS